MTRKFLFCFPLRVGNIVFGYIVIISSIAVVAYHLYQLGLTVVVPEDEYDKFDKFRNWENLEKIFGQKKNSMVAVVTMLYYTSYIAVGGLMFLFSSLFACGAYKANYCLVTTFFGYTFFHLFLTILLIVWEATSAGWIQLGIILASNVILIVCLFSVKNLMEAIRTGKIYSQPGEVYYRY